MNKIMVTKGEDSTFVELTPKTIVLTGADEDEFYGWLVSSNHPFSNASFAGDIVAGDIVAGVFGIPNDLISAHEGDVAAWARSHGLSVTESPCDSIVQYE